VENASKNELLAEVRRMLQELFLEHQRGASGLRWTRTHGYLDGYMRGLVDSGAVSHRELLTLVGEQRSRTSGPALGELQPESSAA
jgi:hypothetical protein